MQVGKGKRPRSKNQPKRKPPLLRAERQRATSGRKEAPRITEDADIKEVLDRFPDLFGVFEDHGLHFCAGCYVMLASTIGEGADYSGLKPADRQALLAELNRAVLYGVHGAAQQSPSTP